MFIEDYGKWTKVEYRRPPTEEERLSESWAGWITKKETLKGFSYTPAIELYFWTNSSDETTSGFFCRFTKYRKKEKYIRKVSYIKNGESDVVPLGLASLRIVATILFIPIAIPLVAVILVAEAIAELRDADSSFRRLLRRIRF